MENLEEIQSKIQTILYLLEEEKEEINLKEEFDSIKNSLTFFENEKYLNSSEISLFNEYLFDKVFENLSNKKEDLSKTLEILNSALSILMDKIRKAKLKKEISKIGVDEFL